MNNRCISIQEKILFKDILGDAEAKHVKTCPDCMGAAFENQQLLEIFQHVKEPVLSVDFADKVMGQIYSMQHVNNRKMTFKDYFLLSPIFKTAIFAGLFIFPVFLGSF